MTTHRTRRGTSRHPGVFAAAARRHGGVSAARRRLGFVAAALALGLALAACGEREGGAPAALEVSDGWVRAAPPGARMTAAYGTLENPGASPRVVVGWASPQWRDVSLHRTVTEGDVRRMEPVERLEVPARGDVTLEPGGLHLMLMGPVGELAEGAAVTVEARREDGSVDTLAFVVARR